MATRNEVAILITAIDNASRILEDARRSINDTERAADQASRGGMANLQARLERGEQASRQFAVAIGAAAAALVAAGTGAVVLAGQYEQAEIAFTTMLGSAQEADAFLRDLADFSARTPFEFRGLQDSTRKLLAFGFEAEQLIPMLSTIGDAVAALGGGAFEIDRVTRALGQMQAKGNLATQEIMQLAELGVPAWELLAESIGVSVPEAMAMVEARAIDAATGINGILEGLDRRFAGSMEQQSATLLGLWSTVKDEVGLSLTAIGNDIVDTFDLKAKLAGAIEWLGNLRETIEEQGISGLLEDYRAGIAIVAGVIAGALVPALWATVTAAAAAAVALAPFLIGGAVIGGLVAVALQLRGTSESADKLAASLEKSGERALKAKDAIGELKDATDENGLQGAVQTLAQTMDLQGSEALLAFAEDTAFPLAAQGELQGAIELTIAKFAELSAASSMAELNAARALVSQTGRQIDLIKDNLVGLAEDLEKARDDGASAFDLNYIGDLIADERAELARLEETYAQQMDTVNQLNDRTVLYAQTLEGVRSGALTAEEAVARLNEAFGIAARVGGARPDRPGSNRSGSSAGTGGGGRDRAPEGSLARLKQELKAEQEAFDHAATESAREASNERIRIIEAEIAAIERLYSQARPSLAQQRQQIRDRNAAVSFADTISGEAPLAATQAEREREERAERERRARSQAGARRYGLWQGQLASIMGSHQGVADRRDEVAGLQAATRAANEYSTALDNLNAMSGRSGDRQQQQAQRRREEIDARARSFQQLRDLQSSFAAVAADAADYAREQEFKEAADAANDYATALDRLNLQSLHSAERQEREAAARRELLAVMQQGRQIARDLNSSQANVDTDLVEQIRAGSKVIHELRGDLELADQQAGLFGDTFDDVGAKAGLVENAITSLLTAGLDPQSERVQELVRLWRELTAEQTAATSAAEAQKKALDTINDVTRVATALNDALGLGLGDVISGISSLAAAIATGNPFEMVAAGLELAVALFGNFNDGLAEIQEQIKETAESARLLGRELVDSLSSIEGVRRTVRQDNFWGVVFGATREEIDQQAFEAALSIAESVATGFASGIQQGIDAWLRGEDDWKDQLAEGIKGAIFDALLNAFLEAAILQAGVQDFIAEFVRISQEEGREAAMAYARENYRGVVDELTGMTEDFLNSIPEDLKPDRGGSNAGADSGQSARVQREVSFGGTPHAVQFAVATPLVEAADTMLLAAEMMVEVLGGSRPASADFDLFHQSVQEFNTGVGNFGGFIDRLVDEGIRVRLEQTAPTTTGSGFGTAHLRSL